MNISGYLNEIRELAETRRATAHSYRPALKRLFKSIGSDLTVINEPKRLADVGARQCKTIQNGASCAQRLDPTKGATYTSEQLRNTLTEIARK